MTSTLVTPEDLKDLSAGQLQSKFFQISCDVMRMRQACAALPLAEASLQNVSRALAERRNRPPKP